MALAKLFAKAIRFGPFEETAGGSGAWFELEDLEPRRVTSLVTRLVTRHTASNGASNALLAPLLAPTSSGASNGASNALLAPELG